MVRRWSMAFTLAVDVSRLSATVVSLAPSPLVVNEEPSTPVLCSVHFIVGAKEPLNRTVQVMLTSSPSLTIVLFIVHLGIVSKQKDKLEDISFFYSAIIIMPSQPETVMLLRTEDRQMCCPLNVSARLIGQGKEGGAGVDAGMLHSSGWQGQDLSCDDSGGHWELFEDAEHLFSSAYHRLIYGSDLCEVPIDWIESNRWLTGQSHVIAHNDCFGQRTIPGWTFSWRTNSAKRLQSNTLSYQSKSMRLIFIKISFS